MRCKKRLAAFLTIILVIAIFLPYIGELIAANAVESGDYNADNVVNTCDLVRLKSYLEGSTSDITTAAEWNWDEVIDKNDLSDLREAMVGNLSKEVLEDDGTFEGKAGYISLSGPQQIENAEGQWASNVLFRRVDGVDGKVMSVSSDGTHPYDYLYIKFATPIKAGCEYTISMELTAQDNSQTSGAWGYWFTNDVTANGDSGLEIQSHNTILANTLFDGNGVSFSLTSDEDYDDFYLVLREESLNTGVTFNFTIDNVKIITDYILNDDGSFEGYAGNISLYSSKVASEITSGDLVYQNGAMFQKVKKNNSTALSITSEGESDRFDLVFLKFDETLHAGTNYTISYEAEWTGAVEPASYGFAIMPNTGNWLVADDNIVSYDECHVKWYDGDVEIRFTPDTEVTSFYLVLADQSVDTGIHMVIDNVRLEQTYLVGMCEGTSEINTEVENSLTIDYVSAVTGVYGARSYRLWMHFDKLLYVDSNNRVCLNEAVASAFHKLIDSLEEQGVERFIGMTSTFVYPCGYEASTNNVVPDPQTESEAYLAFLEILAESFRVVAEEFPEVQYFEPGNEPDIENGQNLCRNGYVWDGTTEENASYVYTDEESAQIVADMMWYTKNTVTQVNAENKVLNPALCGYSSTVDYLGLIYDAIESGKFPTGQTTQVIEADEYFDILNWHPYLLGTDVGVDAMGNAWKTLQENIYAVATAHGDGEKPVWFTEMGFTDRGNINYLDAMADSMVQLFDYVKNDLTFVETVFVYRISNLTGDAALNEFESNFGLFYSLNEEDITLAGEPKPIAIAFYKWLYGEYTDLTPLYDLADWSLDGSVLANMVRNDDGTFEGNTGCYSLLSPRLIKGSEGELWANEIYFDKMENEDGHALTVKSSGDHRIEYLYIKVDKPLINGGEYTITMDIEALDEETINGHYGFWVFSPDANIDSPVQGFKEVETVDFFKTDATFKFVANGNYDYFYLVLREYTLEELGEDYQFNFSVDNIEIEEYIGETAVLKDDGTFEGVVGNISFYSPTETSEITNTQYHQHNPIYFRQVEKTDGTHSLAARSTGGEWDVIFMKFDSPIEKGHSYEITYDATWNGETSSEDYGYAIMPNTSNWLDAEPDNIANYNPNLKWYDGKVTISFDANADWDSWYLVLVDQEGVVPLDVEFDNICIEEVLNSVLDDDGTFEDQKGTISLLTAHQIAGAEGNGWSTQVAFEEVADGDNHAIAVTSSGENPIDYLYIKVDEPVKTNGIYEITMDMEALDEQCANGQFGYWVLTPEANATNPIQTFTTKSSADWFTEEATFRFTSNGDYDYFYLLLREYTPENSGLTDAKFNFTIDNVYFTELLDAVVADDGTFEEVEGNVSLYSPTDTEHIQSSTYHNYKQIEFKRVRKSDGTHALSMESTGTAWDTVFIKFDYPIVSGQKYEITYDATWNGYSVPVEYGYAVMPNTSNWVTSDASNTQANIVDFNNTVKWYDGAVTITFEANTTTNSWYLVLVNQTTQVSLDMKIDNIYVTKVYDAFVSDNGSFEGETGYVSLYSPTVTSEITNTTYHAYNPIQFKRVRKSNGTYALSTKSTGVNWDTLFMKFDYPIVAGKKYTITYDATWNGASVPVTYGYAVMPNTANWVGYLESNSPLNMTDYNPSVAWYDGKVSITFEANATMNSWYLTFIIQDMNVTLDMEFDNICVTELVE